MEQHHTKINQNLTIILVLILLSLFITPTYSQPLPHKTIAITEIVAHPSLMEAKRGIVDVLKEHGYIEGTNLTILQANAQNNLATSAMIAKKWASIKPDAIVPISTPSAQTVIKATQGTSIPVVFSSVTDPIAAGLVTQLSNNDRITGAIDQPPLSANLQLMKALVPNLKTIGFLYNPSEANSVKTLALLKETAGDIQIIAVSVNNTNEIKMALHSLVGKANAIYLPSDNTVFSCLPTVIKLSREHKLPLFSSDPDSVKQGVLACVGYTQYDVGRTAGEQLVKALAGEKNLPILTPSRVSLFVNRTTGSILGLSLPAEQSGMTVIVVE